MEWSGKISKSQYLKCLGDVMHWSYQAGKITSVCDSLINQAYFSSFSTLPLWYMFPLLTLSLIPRLAILYYTENKCTYRDSFWKTTTTQTLHCEMTVGQVWGRNSTLNFRKVAKSHFLFSVLNNSHCLQCFKRVLPHRTSRNLHLLFSPPILLAWNKNKRDDR